MSLTDSERACLKLLGQIRKAELAAIASQEEEKIADIDRARGVVVVKLQESPHGLAYTYLELAKSGVWQRDESNSLNAKTCKQYLLRKFGEANSARTPLSDEDAQMIFAFAFLGAETWEYAAEICATELGARRELPDALKKFASWVIRDNKMPKLRGQPMHRNIWRDTMVCLIAKQLEKRFDLRKTRNSTSTADSICSVIAEALNDYGYPIQEEAVRKILL